MCHAVEVVPWREVLRDIGQVLTGLEHKVTETGNAIIYFVILIAMVVHAKGIVHQSYM